MTGPRFAGLVLGVLLLTALLITTVASLTAVLYALVDEAGHPGLPVFLRLAAVCALIWVVLGGVVLRWRSRRGERAASGG